ncbi:MAG: hypothetical protein FD149_2099 [Rhodospirillaceae bacterium]|nr:MAG: hypothetical protein FD149_2099 [Rhodospirillaceae bacterium]
MREARRQLRREKVARVLFTVNLAGLVVAVAHAGVVFRGGAVVYPLLAAGTFFLGVLIPVIKESLGLHNYYDSISGDFSGRHDASPATGQIFADTLPLLTHRALVPVTLALWFALLGGGFLVVGLLA